MSASVSNKHRYTSSRLNHILSSIPFAFKSLFCKRDKKLIVFCAMHCDTFISNSKFLFLYFLKNKPEYTVKFVINNDELRQELTAEYGEYFIDTRTKEGKEIAIRAGAWVVSWLDLPIGGLFLNFRRYVLHLGHGTPLKGIGMAEKDGKLIKKLYYKLNNTNLTCSLAASEWLSTIISACMGYSKKHILVSGQPRNDALFAEPLDVPEIDKTKFNILYAPTWRQYAEVKLFPFADFDLQKMDSFLGENNMKIFIRMHPAYEASVPKEMLECKNISLFQASKYPEVMDYLNCFDSLITDYSSIYLDYMLLERPIVFLPYDYEDYANSVGFTMDYFENTPGLKPDTFDGFTKVLEEIKNQPEKSIQLIKDLNPKLNILTKDSCNYLAKVIIDNLQN